MARINIEECWWSDPRRMALIELVGVGVADGAAVNMWRLAQEFWSKGMSLIPKEVFDKLKHSSALVDSGLAEVRECSVYVRGSSEYLSWVKEKREAGKANGQKGGLASAEARRKKYGSAVPISASNSEANPNQTPNGSPNESEANRTNPNPSGSGSGSGSSSKYNKTIAQPDGFAEFWLGYPRKIGKHKALKSYIAALKNGAQPKDILAARDNYRKHLEANQTESKFIKHGSTFMNEWRDWLEVDAGQSEDFGKSKQGTGEFRGGWADIDGVA